MLLLWRLADGKGYTNIYSSTLMLSDQYQEVLPSSNMNFTISLGDNRFYDVEPSNWESLESRESMQGSSRKIGSNRQGAVQSKGWPNTGC